MRKALFITALTALTAVVACTTDDPFDNYSGVPGAAGGGSSSGSSAITGSLTSFEVSVDKTTEEPSDAAAPTFPDTEDDPSAFSPAIEVAINMAAPVASTADGVTISVNGGHVVADHGTTTGVCYVLSGTTSNGSFTVVGEKKYGVTLSGVSITNPDSAAINLLSKKRAYITLSGSNTVKDGTTSQNDHKGAFYAKGKLLFGGTGSLEVYGNYNNGIHTADYAVFNSGANIYVKSTAGHGVKANDGIYINGGILNVEVTAAGAKGINCESNIVVNGGRTTVVTTGNGYYDTTDQEAKGAACIKADTLLTVNGGELWLKSTGSGGKGIKAGSMATFNGGTVCVVTEGSQFSSNRDTASPKGIKADGNININGGTIWVRTSGTNGEGIESKALLTISGGEVASYAYDDAINSKSHMTISGGSVFAQGQHNDGLDSNGNTYIKGGLVYAVCSGQPEVAIDANTEGGYKLYVQGGTIIAVGGLESGSSLTQSCYQATTWNSNKWYALTGGSSTVAFKTPSSGGSGIVVSTSLTPSLTSGVTTSGGTALFGGLVCTGATVSGGSSVQLSSYSGGRAMGGGGMPGGFW